jgi:hypothetical protein
MHMAIDAEESSFWNTRPAPQGSLRTQLSAMGFDDTRIELASARASTVADAVAWIFNESESVIHRLHVSDAHRAVGAPDLNMTQFLPQGVYAAVRRKYTEDEIKAIVKNMYIG